MSELATIWNRRYSQTDGAIHPSRYEPWLDRWQSVLAERPGRALDLGCGAGFDTEVLLRWGFEVTAVDVSAAAIALSEERNPEAKHLVADIRSVDRLSSRFDLIVASLSLHYFNREETEAIFLAIHKILEPGGYFAFRINAFDDVESGSPSNPLSWECVSVDGVPKQFFTEKKIARLLNRQFHILAQEKLVTFRYGHRKSLFEVIVQKRPNSYE